MVKRNTYLKRNKENGQIEERGNYKGQMKAEQIVVCMERI